MSTLSAAKVSAWKTIWRPMWMPTLSHRTTRSEGILNFDSPDGSERRLGKKPGAQGPQWAQAHEYHEHRAPQNRRRSGPSGSKLLVVIEVVAAGGQILEPCVLAQERQANKPDRTVPLLTDNDLGHAFVFGLGVVHLVAVHKHDHVGVLLASTGFTQ